MICAAIAAVGVFGALRLRASYLQRTRQALENEAELVWELVRGDLLSGHTAEVSARLKALQPSLECRITVIAADGTVVADNEAEPARMENHRTRPEVIDASASGVGSSIRYSDTIHQDLLYVARRMPVEPPGGTFGDAVYVRLAVHLATLDRQLRLLYTAMATVAVAAMAVATSLCFYLARRHAEPVRELAEFAGGLSRGELERRILMPGDGEIGTLTHSLNTMAESLNHLVAQTTHDRAELAAIVASMSEGVIATDTRLIILLCNTKAAELLDFPSDQVVGKSLWEVLRLEPILKAASEALKGEELLAFPVSPALGRHLEVTICRFPSKGPAGGLVIVAHDTTRSVRYQELRKEFVANVSHELRTPLTVIKGFTETLQDGALQDPVKGPEFLATIVRHVDQLTNLVNDLLELSRLEGSPELPRPVSVDVGAVSRKVADLLMPAAQKKRQTLRLDVAGYVPRVRGNPDYLERAIANLVDNAIKYTHEGGNVSVDVSSDDSEVQVDVTDNGLGIPPDDVPRIFERFYRVDRSRSREMGGTGLGLSIVKHVAQVHGGGIEVFSTPGSGTRFRLTLPLPEE